MMHTKTLFVFDWDDVVADREQLRALAADIFRLAGVAPQTEQLLYERAREDGGYSFRQHLRGVLRYYPHLISSAATLHRSFEESFDRLGTRVYPDAQRFIERLHGEFPLAVISAGDPEFQQHKIGRSRLANFFRHMLFVPSRADRLARAKSRALGQLLELYPRIVYFGHHADVIGHVHDEHSRHGRVIPIRVFRDAPVTLKYPNLVRNFDEVDVSSY